MLWPPANMKYKDSTKKLHIYIQDQVRVYSIKMKFCSDYSVSNVIVLTVRHHLTCWNKVFSWKKFFLSFFLFSFTCFVVVAVFYPMKLCIKDIGFSMTFLPKGNYVKFWFTLQRRKELVDRCSVSLFHNVCVRAPCFV